MVGIQAKDPNLGATRRAALCLLKLKSGLGGALGLLGALLAHQEARVGRWAMGLVPPAARPLFISIELHGLAVNFVFGLK